MKLAAHCHPTDMALSFAQLWQKPERADVDFILLAPSELGRQEEQHDDAARHVMLTSFPGHSAMLCNSPVLWAKVRDRWPPVVMAATAAAAVVHDASCRFVFILHAPACISRL